MSRRKKPHCFVAMAFDYDDTDKIYENAIEKVLKRNSVVPIIINRKEDNRDINLQIINELNNCDFCITDLTYARPSVYFEAGYAQRQVEVIYTVRSDHLKKNQPEDRRVHFDLQMKPLIRWKNPDDPAFPKNLERRLRSTALREFNIRVKQSDRDKIEKEKFQSISIDNKIELFQKRALDASIKSGFTDWTIVHGLGAYDRGRTYKNPLRFIKKGAIFVSSKIHNKTFHVLIIETHESINLKQLKDGKWVHGYYAGFYWDFPENLYSKVRAIKINRIMLSIKNVPDARIMSAMPKLTKNTLKKRYVHGEKYKLRPYKVKETREHIPLDVHFYFIDSMSSDAELKSKLKEVTETIKSDM